MKIITFLSDFGERDWFVGAVKGEIIKINRNVSIIDITHNLIPHDVRSAAFVLKSVYRNFPKRTVHLVVIDPGVGSARKPIIVESDDYFFVGPDNGVFSYIYDKDSKVYVIRSKEALSITFHARDIFGPVAAQLSKNVKPLSLGHRLKDYITFEFPKIEEKKGRVYGEVVYIDHFGNLITNIPNQIEVTGFRIADKRVPVKKNYMEGEVGALIAVKGSCGNYEIASKRGNASRVADARIGTNVIARVA